LHRDFHDAKRLLGIAGLARRKVSFSFMRVQARAGAKHVKRRGYYFDPKSSGYPEAHCQTPVMAGCYAHAKQFKRHQRQLRLLRSRLGRLIRDIAR
jgi:hypothetical protein